MHVHVTDHTFPCPSVHCNIKTFKKRLFTDIFIGISVNLFFKVPPSFTRRWTQLQHTVQVWTWL